MFCKNNSKFLDDLKVPDESISKTISYLEENNIGIGNIHIDDEASYAGVLYLTPNPPADSGTSFYNESNIETHYLENIYNRLVIYPSHKSHSLKNAFGDAINNGRLTFTFFCTLKQKNKKTII